MTKLFAQMFYLIITIRSSISSINMTKTAKLPNVYENLNNNIKIKNINKKTDML